MHFITMEYIDGQDLQSTNGTFLNGVRIQRTLLPESVRLELARGGPAISLEIERLPEPVGAKLPVQQESFTKLAQHYFATVVTDKLGDRTMIIRQAFQTVRRKQSKHYWTIISVILVILLGTAGALYYQSQRLHKMQALAEDIFYSMKSLELQVAKLQSLVIQQADPQMRNQVREKMRQQGELKENYGNFARELGISRDKLSERDWLVYKVARLFGECDVSMPPEFLQKVHQYIGFWQSTPRLQDAIARAEVNGYAARIANEMLEHDMPPEFFYLALQESDFDLYRCGPPTRFGIAKGMWQFIPETGRRYGLRTGPLVELRRSDPRDERHNFEKSTRAAAAYLRRIYETDAQASGLLVIASYNWGEGNILSRIRSLPADPRERNFWKLLSRKKIPRETYDYVFYIVSAAVIGENPRLFGFDFDSPLKHK